MEAEIIEGSKEEEEGRARFATERWVSGPFSLYFFLSHSLPSHTARQWRIRTSAVCVQRPHPP